MSNNVWSEAKQKKVKAIDSFAKAKGTTASGLARMSGLNPTTFNKSKRMTEYGQERWPSTQSLSKILNATNTSFSEFAKYIQD